MFTMNMRKGCTLFVHLKAKRKSGSRKRLPDVPPIDALYFPYKRFLKAVEFRYNAQRQVSRKKAKVPRHARSSSFQAGEASPRSSASRMLET